MSQQEKLSELQQELDLANEQLSGVNTALSIVGEDDKVSWQIKRLEIEEHIEQLNHQIESVLLTPDNNEEAPIMAMPSEDTIMAMPQEAKILEEKSNEDDIALNEKMLNDMLSFAETDNLSTNQENSENLDEMLNSLLNEADTMETAAPQVVFGGTANNVIEQPQVNIPIAPQMESYSPKLNLQDEELRETAKLEKELLASLQSIDNMPIKAKEDVASDANSDIVKLRQEAENMRERAELALKQAQQIKLTAETERAMFAAEMELERGKRSEENNMREQSIKQEKARISEKVARRKAEITQLRNNLSDIKDSEAAFIVREKIFSIQLVLDDEERSSAEINYLITKTMDDINHAVEISELKRKIAALTRAKRPAPKKKPAAKKAAAKKAPTRSAARSRTAASGAPRRRTSASSTRAASPRPSAPRRKPAPRPSAYY